MEADIKLVLLPRDYHATRWHQIYCVSTILETARFLSANVIGLLKKSSS